MSDPYMRIVMVFDTNETAGRFLREDGEGGFAAGVSRMADSIDKLTAALEPLKSGIDSSTWHDVQ